MKPLNFALIASLEKDLEEQKGVHEEHTQYTRRTALKLLNVPVGNDGESSNHLDSILKICRDKHKVILSPKSISRCHRLGPITEGKANIIVRFVRYFDRQCICRMIKFG